MKRRHKVLLISSSGGVLLDLLALKPWWSRHKTAWAAVRAEDTHSMLPRSRTIWIRERPGTSPLQLLAGIRDAVRIIRRFRPDLIVSAGSGAAVGFFLVAYALRIPSFWIETMNMGKDRGISSRICARIASEVIVQRQSLLQVHPGAVCIGELY